MLKKQVSLLLTTIHSSSLIAIPANLAKKPYVQNSQIYIHYTDVLIGKYLLVSNWNTHSSLVCTDGHY